MITIHQGESCRIFVSLWQDGVALVPEMIEDLKICIGDTFSKTWKQGGVQFDYGENQWCIFPTQQETLAMKRGKKNVCVHVKYLDGSVIIAEIDSVKILESCCKEVF